MIIFLRKTAIFISIFFCIFFTVLFAFNFYINRTFDQYRVGENINIVFIGDSHIQLTIDDRLIPHTANLSQQAESFYFNYYKIKKILEKNPSINTVYLGFSYQNLSIYYEDYIFGKRSKDISARYFFILPFREKMIHIRYNYKALGSYFQVILVKGIENIFADNPDKSYLGKFENNSKNGCAAKKAMDDRLDAQFYKDGAIQKFSTFNLSYFNKIVDLCKNNNIELVLLDTPVHQYYGNKIPSVYIKEYDEFVKLKQLKRITFDNDSLHLTDSCFIQDGDHVSQKGAAITSAYFNEFLKSKNQRDN